MSMTLGQSATSQKSFSMPASSNQRLRLRRRYPILDNHLYTGSFASDFATSSALYLVNFASFSGLSALGGVASQHIF